MQLAAKVGAATLLADQVTKTAVLYGLNLIERGSMDVLPPWLSFHVAWNSGINFGLFAQSSDLARWILVAISLAIALWVWLWVRREPHRAIVQVSAGLLIGGAIGNVMDRIIYGSVADFLNMSAPGIENPYSFNVADVAIFAGAIGLVLFTGHGQKGRKKKS